MRPARIAAALALALTLVACAASQDQSGNDLVDTLADARENPQKRVAAEVACERVFARRGAAFPFQSFASGLLDVSQGSGDRAFCAALVEAIVAGHLTRADLTAFQRPSEIRGKAPLGTLLRAVVEANERLQTRQAQKPPQALSCGCGQ